jgi:hypothetical protein
MRQPFDLGAFLEPGVAMLGASADDDLVPEAFRAYAPSWDSSGRVRALISSDAGSTLATVKPGSWLCFTFVDMTLRSVQVKGRAVSGPEPPGPADVQRMRRYLEKFFAAVETRGVSRALVEAHRPVAVFAVTITVEEMYDQTPGPTAGTRLDGHHEETGH